MSKTILAFTVLGLIACGGNTSIGGRLGATGGGSGTSGGGGGGSGGNSGGGGGTPGDVHADLGPPSDGGACTCALPPTSSGTRIKTLFVTTPDGLKQPAGYHDAQLDSDCGFARASDGVIRCLPLAVARDVYFYADADCKNDVIDVSCDAPAPRYVYSYEKSATCNGNGRYVYRIFAVGSEVTSVYVDGPNGCMPNTDNGSYKFYGVGSEVAPDSFVAGTYVTQ